MSKRKCRRKHTPITTEAQRGLFGVWRGHPERRPKSITAAEVGAHLREAGGKKLPARARRRKRRR